MFTTDRFFFRTWAGWYLTIIVSILIYGVSPRPVVIPMVVISALTFFWCLKCAYRTERFSDYALFRMVFSLGMGPLLAFVFSMALMYKMRGFHWALSILIGVLPFLIVGLIYAFFYFGKGRSSVFILQGNRVEVHEPAQANPWLLAGIATGLSSLSYPIMQAYGIPMESLMILVVVCSFYNVYYFRAHIVSLKALRAREKREQRHYTFHDIEHLRQLRQASLLGRLFAAQNKH